MHRQCLKRFIGLQLVIAIALVTAIVLAYYLQKSSRTGPTGIPGSTNSSAPFYDGEKYTTGDDKSSPTAIDVVDEQQTKDGLATSQTEDDFIHTIEMPQLPPGIDLSPRLDNTFEQGATIEAPLTKHNDETDPNSMAYAFGRTRRKHRREERQAGKLVKNLKATRAPAVIQENIPRDISNDGSDSESSDVPSDGPSLEPSIVHSDVPSDGPSLEPSLVRRESAMVAQGSGDDERNFGGQFSEGLTTDIEPISPEPKPTPRPTFSFDDLIVDFVEGLHSDTSVSSSDTSCPPSHEYSTACSDEMVGRECFYDYAYTGCNWRSLECLPMVECKCENPLGPGQGRWSCKQNFAISCRLRSRPGLPAAGHTCDPDQPKGVFRPQIDFTAKDLPIVSSITDPPTINEQSSEMPSVLPMDEKDFVSEMFSNNLTEVEDLSSECPLSPDYGECSGYEDGLHCNFDYIYKGCNWDNLECAPAIECDCSEGYWDCVVDFTTPCDVTVDGHPPGGIPWGEACDPSAPIEIPTKKSDCPNNLAIGSCIEYENNLSCDYNHAYKGCSWDEFECAPTVICDCQDDFWKCYGAFQDICSLNDGKSTVPEGLPWGNYCDPTDDSELLEYLRNRPTNAPSVAPSLAPIVLNAEDSQIKLLDECPMVFEYGECLNAYVDGLMCPYDYAFKGCTWDELSCEPSIQCKCDHWLGYWQCKSSFENCFEDGPMVVGLPWGETCDPAAELPQPPP